MFIALLAASIGSRCSLSARHEASCPNCLEIVLLLTAAESPRTCYQGSQGYPFSHQQLHCRLIPSLVEWTWSKILAKEIEVTRVVVHPFAARVSNRRGSFNTFKLCHTTQKEKEKRAEAKAEERVKRGGRAQLNQLPQTYCLLIDRIVFPEQYF